MPSKMVWNISIHVSDEEDIGHFTTAQFETLRDVTEYVHLMAKKYMMLDFMVTRLDYKNIKAEKE